MKARAYLQQARNSPAQYHTALCWIRDAAKYFQQRAFASTIAADNADDLALLDLEAHILQRPELLNPSPCTIWRPRNTSTALRAKLRASRTITSRNVEACSRCAARCPTR